MTLTLEQDVQKIDPFAFGTYVLLKKKGIGLFCCLEDLISQAESSTGYYKIV